MFSGIRGLFAADASDVAPEQPAASSSSSETQDTFAPADGEDDAPDASSLEATPPAAPGAPSAPKVGGFSRSGGLRGVGGGTFRSGRDGDVFSSDQLFQDDDGTDTGGTKRRRPLAQRADVAVIEGGKPIETLGDAVEHVTAAMDRQIERGHTDGFRPNESIVGDSAARTTFYTLLPDIEQREVFLSIAGDMRNWARLRALFGAPPYNFLKSEDAGMLRAAGIAQGRSNMAHEDSQSAANYTQFGVGQLIDEEEREYRVTPHEQIKSTDPAPFLLETHAGADIVLQVRVKKRDRKRKLEMLKDKDARRTLTFPRPGDHIVLSPTQGMLSIQRRRSSNLQPITLRVKRVIPRGESAATAAVVAQRV